MTAIPIAEPAAADGQLITGTAAALQLTHLHRGDVLLVQTTGRLHGANRDAIKAKLDTAIGAPGTGVQTLVLDGDYTLSVLRPDRGDELTTDALDGTRCTISITAPGRPVSYEAAMAQAKAERPPRIGHPWPAQGGIYAGIARGVEGAADHHLILAPVVPSALLAWQPARDWARGLAHTAFTDWDLPTRAESALLFAQLRDQLEHGWHWTSEAYRPDGAFAWSQHFGGGQEYVRKIFESHARAVRRLAVHALGA